MVSKKQAAKEIAERRQARAVLLDYIVYSSQNYKLSSFAETVCAALDKFILDVQAGKRPILVLQAPPQHGKSEIVSRKLPAFLMGINPEWRIGTASYSTMLANSMAQDVRRNLASHEHKSLFPLVLEKRKYDRNTISEFNAPGGAGSYVAVGIGSGLSGKRIDIGIIDDPTKDQQEALSDVTKENHWSWYQATFTSRLSQNSGTIIMATSWAEDDLPARIINQYRDDLRLTLLQFPAINEPGEVGYNRDLPRGPLVPQLHSLDKLLEQKGLMSDYWWSALYQQRPKALGGNVFKLTNDAGQSCVQFYLPKDLPDKFDKVIDSWDCTFKDTDGTDYVVGQKWGKKGASCYLLHQIRGRLSFTKTAEKVKLLREMEPISREILIEDKANGPAVIDFLKKTVFGIQAIEPDGSKLARAHAVTSVWEGCNVWLPHPEIAPWIGDVKGNHKPDSFISELTVFDKGAHDDQVDAFTQAMRKLYPLFGRLKISNEALRAMAGKR